MPDMTNAIELTPAEASIRARIGFDAAELQAAQRIEDNGEAVVELLASLIERRAIPDIRRKYFTDPKYFTGRAKTSWKGVFESYGEEGEEIFRHPQFLKFLRYFLDGPDLPRPLMATFQDKVGDHGADTVGDVEPLCALARDLARQYAMVPSRASEEFYKLALECGLSEPRARHVRNAVHAMK